MRLSLVIACLCLSILAACSSGTGSTVRGDDDHIQACQEQSEWARSGTIPTGEIAISCPEHGIGDYQ
jgi:hypothetical protein